jgi:hypothetical protein
MDSELWVRLGARPGVEGYPRGRRTRSDDGGYGRLSPFDILQDLRMAVAVAVDRSVDMDLRASRRGRRY